MHNDMLRVLQTAVEDPLVPGAAATVLLAGEQIDLATPHSDHPELSADELKYRPFRIASVTKSFVAAALFRLSEQKALHLHDPIENALSRETRAQLAGAGYDPLKITIRHLLTHTSGIRDHLSDQYQTAVLNDPQKKWAPTDQIAFSSGLGGPLFEPGRGFSYADTGYILLGEIIEVASSEPLAEAVRLLLKFDQLGLHNTWWEALEQPRTELSNLRTQYFGEANGRSWDPSFDLFGGGGLISTTQDLCVLMRALVRGNLFDNPATLAAGLWVPEVARNEDDFFTLRARYVHATWPARWLGS